MAEAVCLQGILILLLLLLDLEELLVVMKYRQWDL